MPLISGKHRLHHKVRRKLIILFIVGTTSVFPTLWGPFIFDDGEAIVKNEDVTAPDKTSVLQIFRHDFWGSKLANQQSHKSYRPLTTLTYRIDYQLYGEDPFMFHLIDLLLHGVNCCLVYLFLRKCLSPLAKESDLNQKTEVAKSNDSVHSKSAAISSKQRSHVTKDEVCYWASILFAVHPIHVEPVGTLVGRADLLSGLIFLLTYILISEVPSLITTMQLALIGIVGSLFKENTVVIIIFYVGVHILKQESFWSIKPRYLVFHGLTLLSGITFIQWRLWFQNGPPVFQPYDNPAVFADNIFTKISSVIYIWLFNAFLLLCPIWLCYDWSMGCISLIESPLDVRFSLMTIAIMAIVVFLYKSYPSKYANSFRFKYK